MDKERAVAIAATHQGEDETIIGSCIAKGTGVSWWNFLANIRPKPYLLTMTDKRLFLDRLGADESIIQTQEWPRDSIGAVAVEKKDLD